MSTVPRFSDDELIDIINVTRLRSPVTRSNGPDFDCVDLIIPDIVGMSIRFQRDATCTALLLVGPDEWKLMTTGTLAECLGFFR